jgi:hypothetical protein
MEISDFYSLGSKLSSRTVQAHPIYPKYDRDKYYNLIRGEYDGFDFPVIFKQEYGNKLEDILDTGTPALYLISERLKLLLENEGLTGWNTFEIKVFDKKGMEINGYYGFSVTGHCGKIDNSRSEIIEKQSIPNGPMGKYRKGLYVGLETWDGSDFFYPEGTLFFVSTKKATEIIKSNEITNVRFENLMDVETPVLNF